MIIIIPALSTDGVKQVIAMKRIIAAEVKRHASGVLSFNFKRIKNINELIIDK